MTALQPDHRSGQLVIGRRAPGFQLQIQESKPLQRFGNVATVPRGPHLLVDRQEAAIHAIMSASRYLRPFDPGNSNSGATPPRVQLDPTARAASPRSLFLSPPPLR
jgi:hypothetical protein